MVSVTKGKRFLAAALAVCFIGLTGCSLSTPTQSFESNSRLSNFNFLVSSSGDAQTADAFASQLCVVDGNTNTDQLTGISNVSSAGLFDLNNQQVLYAKDVYTRLYPASLTKVMTALVALENATPDQVLTASSNVYMTDAEAQRVDLHEGDTMTLDQALHIMLIYSANDIAIMIAENIGGSVDNFIRMMNEEAASIGATRTNFINSNGLSDENHYTTLYDMYLIFNKALEYSTFNEIISMSNYSTVYHSRDGSQKQISVNTTNQYLLGAKTAPDGVTVIGGKTGTTNAAGHCLVLLARDTTGSPYIAIVMKAWDEDTLYSEMNQILGLIPGAETTSQSTEK